MRIGQTPSPVRQEDFRPARVTVCIVVCIPNQLGYYSRRLDVLKLCLRSLFANTPEGSYELLVLDNGSCPEVVEYLTSLRDQELIDYLLLLRRNAGKINACRMMFGAAPGEIVAFSDDDIFFGPGWLDAQLKLLDVYPRVGMVSGRPVRKQFGYGNKYLEQYLIEFPEVVASYGHFIPEEWEAEYLRSTGRSKKGLSTIAASRTDILLEYRGVKAYSTAAHFQFVSPKSVILAGLSGLDTRNNVSEERKFEECIDQMGYARLSTVDRYVRHIGNVVSRELFEEAVHSFPAMEDVVAWKPPAPMLLGLTRNRFVKGLLRRVNQWSYLLLHHPDP
jgi:glycosyltransferase involved in cell wall biosynthesis